MQNLFQAQLTIFLFNFRNVGEILYEYRRVRKSIGCAF